MKNINKSSALILVLSIVLCTLMFGCNKENKTIVAEASTEAIESIVTVENTTNEEALTVQSSQQLTSNTSVLNSNTSALENSTQPENSTANTSTSVVLTTKQTTTAQATTKVLTTTKVATTTTKPATTTTTTKPSDLVSCTITIDCSQILNKIDKLKDGHEQYLNGNGIILNNKKVTVKQGETVYDALKKVCAENSIPLNAKETTYGSYIVGINNIDEKDCGSASGWMYMVNGTYPNKSVNKYVLQSGDNIVFTYTC